MSPLKSLVIVVFVALIAGPVGDASAQVRYTRSAKLTASDPGRGAGLGYAIAASGDTVVMGELCLQFSRDCSSFEGAAYVYQKPSNGWTDASQVAKLTPSDGHPADGFGYFAVAIDGNTIVVGGNNKAYVYVKPASGWTDMTETAQLFIQTGTSDYIYSASIDGDTIVVGDPYATVKRAADIGAVFVFEKPSAGWTTTAKYKAELTAANQQRSYWGISVAVNNDTIVVGAPNESAKAYVYQRPSSGWRDSTETAILTRSVPDSYNYFGDSVKVVDDTIVIGDPGTPTPSDRQGVVDIFVRPAGGWVNATETAELQAPYHDVVTNFGVSVAFDGKRIVAGTFGGGRAFVYNKPASGGWRSTLRADARLRKWTLEDVFFAYGVAIANDAVIVGDSDSKVGGMGSAGASFVFVPEE